MKKILSFLKANLVYFVLCVVLTAPLFAMLTACGGEKINGPRVEDNEQEQESKTGDKGE